MSQPPTFEPIDETGLQSKPSAPRNRVTILILVCGALLLIIAIAVRFSSMNDATDIQRRVQEARVRRGEDPDAPETAPLRQVVSAEDLIAAYESNEVAADRQFKDRSVVVTGRVRKIGKDIINTMYLVLEGDRVWGVQCMFDDTHEAELASLSKGDKVTLIGTVRGKMGNVILRDCSIR